MIVYPSAKFPTREVVFADSNYLRDALLKQNTNTNKARACFNYDYMQGREAKIISHNRFGPVLQEDQTLISKSNDYSQTPLNMITN